MVLIDFFEEPALDQERTPGSVSGDFLFATAKTSTGSGSAASLKLLFDGDTDYSTKYYKTLNGTSISSGSRVLVLKVSGSYIILGRIQN